MQWFHRLADVPNVGYITDSSIDRSRLPGYKASPKLQVYTWEGKRHESLEWPGLGSASPAHQWTTKPRRGETTGQTALRQLHEALELPGTLTDYHFLISGCCQQLWEWKVRHNEPWVFSALETVCWLDIRLIEAYPEIIRVEQRENAVVLQVRAFDILTYLYSYEGYLREALDVATRAAKLGHHAPDLEKLRQRLAQLEAEDAA